MASDNFNAGTAYTLAHAQDEAHDRASMTKQAVDIFEHMGGRLGAKYVSPNGSFLWRDHDDVDGKTLEAPKFYRWVATIEP